MAQLTPSHLFTRQISEALSPEQHQSQVTEVHLTQVSHRNLKIKRKSTRKSKKKSPKKEREGTTFDAPPQGQSTLFKKKYRIQVIKEEDFTVESCDGEVPHQMPDSIEIHQFANISKESPRKMMTKVKSEFPPIQKCLTEEPIDRLRSVIPYRIIPLGSQPRLDLTKVQSFNHTKSLKPDYADADFFMNQIMDTNTDKKTQRQPLTNMNSMGDDAPCLMFPNKSESLQIDFPIEDTGGLNQLVSRQQSQGSNLDNEVHEEHEDNPMNDEQIAAVPKLHSKQSKANKSIFQSNIVGRKTGKVYETELQERRNHTEHQILHGFWLKTDIMCFITHEKSQHKYWLEMYKFHREKALDKLLLFVSNKNVTIDVVQGDFKRFISILVEENITGALGDLRENKEQRKSQTSFDRRITLHVLDSLKINTKLANGWRKVSNHSLGDNKAYQISKKFQVFGYDQNQGKNQASLILLYQYHTKNQLVKQVDYEKHQRQNYETLIYKIDFLQFFEANHEPSHNILMKTFRHTHDRQILTKLQINFLNYSIIGLFLMKSKIKIIVYSNGLIVRLQTERNALEKIKEEQREKLNMPFKWAENCIFTTFNSQFPMLILQDEKLETIGFTYRHNQWHRQFTFPPMQYRLIKAFGQFLVGLSLHDKAMQLLELGGKKDDEIVSQMPLMYMGKSVKEAKGQLNVMIESSDFVSNFAVKYEIYTNKFQWQKFDQQRQLHHCKPNILEQVCSGYLIKLKLKNSKITFCDLNKFEELENYEFEVKLPTQQAQINSFYPVMSPNRSKILIALSYGRENQEVWSAENFTGLILVDIQKRKSQTVPDIKRCFKEMFFTSEIQIILQKNDDLILVDLIEQQIGDISQSMIQSMQEKNETQFSKSSAHESSASGELEEEIFDFKVQNNYTKGLTPKQPSFANEIEEFAETESYSLESKLIVSAHGDTMIIFDTEKQQLQSINWQKPAYLQNLRTGIRISEDDLELQVLCQLKVPKSCNTEYSNNDQNEYTRWAVCKMQGDDGNNTIFVLMAKRTLAWVYLIEERDGEFSNETEPIFVTQKQVVAILPVNQGQVALQALSELAIINLEKRKIDFKFQFIYIMNFKMTACNGVVAVPRITNGLLIEFGDCEYSKDDDPKHIPKKNKDGKEIQSLRTMNDVRLKFDEIYGSKFSCYLCIDESIVNWNSNQKLLPICIKFQDYVVSEMTKNGVLTYLDYSEWTVLTLIYNNQFTIWEALIREGLLHGTIEINESHLARIINPVLSDNNNSLLHHLSKHNLLQLDRVFKGTRIGERRNDPGKRFPIYLNFDGKSQLDLAIDSYDFESFNYLLTQTINIQEGYESAHLLDSWLVTAIDLSLDLKMLFESKLCTQKLTQQFLHKDTFPDTHKSNTTVTKGYPVDPKKLEDLEFIDFVQLINDEEAAEDLFGETQNQIQKLIKKCSRKKTGEKEQEMHHVVYQVDYFMTSVQKRSAQEQIMIALMNTHNMSYFSAGCIQRLIGYEFVRKFNAWQKVYLYVFLLVYILIIVSVQLSSYERETKAGEIRQWISSFNALIVFFLVFVNEGKELYHKRWRYFKDFWNWLDMGFLISFYGASFIDYKYGTNNEVAGVAELSGIFYALLVILGFSKVLGMARVYNSFSFIIKMQARVIEELLPFLLLFMAEIIVFGLVMFILGVTLMNKDLTPEQQDLNSYSGLGPLAYFVFVARTSFGDNDFEQFFQLPLLLKLSCWAAWVIIVVMNQVIFLNFLIAVISDVYEQVMETRIEEVFKRQTELIVEVGQTPVKDINKGFGKVTTGKIKILKKESISSKILITRQGIVVKDNSKQWSGYLSEIKKSLNSQNSTIEEKIDHNAFNIERDFDTKMLQTNEIISSLNNQIGQLQVSLVFIMKCIKDRKQFKDANNQSSQYANTLDSSRSFKHKKFADSGDSGSSKNLESSFDSDSDSESMTAEEKFNEIIGKTDSEGQGKYSKEQLLKIERMVHEALQELQVATVSETTLDEIPDEK